MEIDLKNNEFNAYMNLIAEKFIYLYNLNESIFDKTFCKMPNDLKVFLFKLYDEKPYEDTKQEDTQDLLLEIFCYYYKSSLYPDKNKEENLTLRNMQHLEQFSFFLDKMSKLLELNSDKFLELFPLCPKAYWDKIDDLRETSFKSYRDSDLYTDCLKKSKHLSFQYELLKGVLVIEEEDDEEIKDEQEELINE